MTVGIKCLPQDNAEARNEVEITRFLSSTPLKDDPENHCIPLLEVLRNPNEPECTFLVEPWVTSCSLEDLSVCDEAMDFMKQTLEARSPNS